MTTPRQTDLLCVITSDPRTNGRPAEAIRIVAGLASWKELALSIYLAGPAALVLADQARDFVDGDSYARYLPLIGQAETPFWVDEENSWLATVNLVEALPIQRITRGRLAEVCAQAKYLMRF